jgi:predicted RNA-binding protein YlxR (DUF448 family)
VVTGATGELVVDEHRRMPGRGAWLHPELGCLELAERRRAFVRALRIAGPVDVAPVRRRLEQLHDTVTGNVPATEPIVEKEAGWKPMATR